MLQVGNSYKLRDGQTIYVLQKLAKSQIEEYRRKPDIFVCVLAGKLVNYPANGKYARDDIKHPLDILID